MVGPLGFASIDIYIYFASFFVMLQTLIKSAIFHKRIIWLLYALYFGILCCWCCCCRCCCYSLEIILCACVSVWVSEWVFFVFIWVLSLNIVHISQSVRQWKSAFIIIAQIVLVLILRVFFVINQSKEQKIEIGTGIANAQDRASVFLYKCVIYVKIWRRNPFQN